MNIVLEMALARERGSGSESGRKNVAAEAQHSNRDVQSSRVRGSEGVENVSQGSRMRGSVCETVSQDSRMRGFGCENVSQGSHVRGSEGCENVSQGSHVRGSEGCQNVSQGLTEKGSVVVSETMPQGSAKGSGVQRFYIGDGPQGSGAVVVAPQGSKNVVVVPDQMGEVVNPFWSETQQREAVREAFGPGYDVSALGLQPGSNASTPQKVHVEQRESVEWVEMDPIELFRLRCLRDAEEKFRQGLLNMGMSAKESRVEKHEHEKGSHGSQSSYVSAVDFQEPVARPNLMMWLNPKWFMIHMWGLYLKRLWRSRGVAPENVVSTVSNDVVEPFVPRPPPGPPPPSPPRMLNSVCGVRVSNTSIPSCTATFSCVCGRKLAKLRWWKSTWKSQDGGASGSCPWMPLLCNLVIGSASSILSWVTCRTRRGIGGPWSGELLISVIGIGWMLGPIERLRLRPQVDPRVHLWPRTERRALAMLLGAIPDPIKEEVISARKLTTDQVLYKLCITFQPGGATERTKLLQNITDSKCGSNVHEVLDWIRTWRRFVQRARELHVTLPDGLVLLGALNKCTDVLSGKSPQVAYRLNMIRQQLNVDQLPTAETILSYSEHLQAEAEELTLSAPAKATSAVRAAALGCAIASWDPSKSSKFPKTSNESDPRFPNSKRKPCRYWMSEKGCTRGDQCSFGHANLDPQETDVSTVLLWVIQNVTVLWRIQGRTPNMIPPKRGVAKVLKPSGRGTPEKSGKGSGEHSSPEKTTGDVAAAEKPLGSETAYRTGRKLGMGEKAPLKGSLGCWVKPLPSWKPSNGCQSCQNQKGECSWWTHRSLGWWGKQTLWEGEPSRTGWSWSCCCGVSTWIGWTETTCFDGDHSHWTCGWTHCAIKGINWPWFCHQMEYPWLWNQTPLKRNHSVLVAKWVSCCVWKTCVRVDSWHWIFGVSQKNPFWKSWNRVWDCAWMVVTKVSECSQKNLEIHEGSRGWHSRGSLALESCPKASTCPS